MAKHIEMQGMRFGRLVVESYNGSDKNGNAKWICQCDCGNKKSVLRSPLISGLTESCGCLNREINSQRATHGMSKSPIYKLWHTMKSRCMSPSNQKYPYYGARGIKVCERWLDFSSFYEDMGEKPPGKSIERINNDGDYEPSNCKWASHKEQSRNKRSNTTVLYMGEVMTMTDAAKAAGISLGTIRGRIKRGWNIQAALYTDPLGAA